MSKFFTTIRSEHFAPSSKYLRPVPKKIHRDVGGRTFLKGNGDGDDEVSDISFSNISSDFSENNGVSGVSGIYENIGDDKQKDENIITIKNSKGEEYELNKASFINSIKEYVQYGDTQITDLPKDLSESFKTIVETLKTIHYNPAPYKMILLEIKNLFAETDNKNITPGSIKSFFVGCVEKTEKTKCDPMCAGSLPPDANGDECEHHVLIYENGTFKSLNAKKSKTAYIYLKGDVLPLNLAQKKVLVDSGIITIFLIKKIPDKDNEVIVANINDIDTHIGTQKENDNTSDENTQTVTIIVLSVLAVLLVLCLIYFFWK